MTTGSKRATLLLPQKHHANKRGLYLLIQLSTNLQPNQSTNHGLGSDEPDRTAVEPVEELNHQIILSFMQNSYSILLQGLILNILSINYSSDGTSISQALTKTIFLPRYVFLPFL